MKFLRALCFLGSVLIPGCHDRSPLSEPSDNLFVYETSFNNQSDLSVQEAVLKADSGGRLYLHLELVNQSENEIQLSAQDWELETVDGLRSSPVNKEDPLTQLYPDSTYIHDFIFEPINSLKLYQLIGFMGDLDPRYTIRFKQNLLSIDFILSDARYIQYREKWSIEKNLDIFVVGPQPGFAKAEIGYLAKQVPLNHPESERIEHGVNVTEQEILIDGLNIDFSSFAMEDTLTVRIRLTNHSPFTASITSSSMRIRLDSIALEPVKDVVDHYEIPKSQRAFVQLKYLLPLQGSPTISLDVSSLTFHTPKPVPVFYQKWISLTKSNL